ncbi:MAG: dienelactone hydrolase family protein [Armatimonas sp.]
MKPEPYPHLCRRPVHAGVHHKLPLLLCLHGSGECGTRLEQVARNGPLKEARAGRHLPFLIVAPQAREEEWDPERLCATLDAVQTEYPIDITRVYATGYSLGGDGVWAVAMYAPERFAAIAPLCGGGDVRKVDRIKQMPIWNFHGAQDWVVKISESQELIDALRRINAPEVKFTVYPDGRHDIWNRTYADPNLYAWLLAHKLA